MDGDYKHRVEHCTDDPLYRFLNLEVAGSVYEVERNTGRMKLPLVLSLLFLFGCAFLPAPLAYLNYARTGFDIKQIITDEPTLTDTALSAATGMDCQIFNVLDDEAICIERVQE